MDQITTTIVAALSAGASSNLTETSKTAVTDAYSKLKDLLTKKFGPTSEVVQTLKQVEAKPESPGRRAILHEEIVAVHAEQDREVLAAARQVLLLIQPPQGSNFTIQNTGPTQGQTIGEGNTVIQHYQTPTPAVGCEVEISKGSLCGIPPIGRCVDCGRALCRSHQRLPGIDQCSHCRDEFEKRSRLLNDAYHYLFEGAAFADLRDSGVPPTAKIVCSYEQWKLKWKRIFRFDEQQPVPKEVTSLQDGWFLGKLQWGVGAHYDTVILSKPLLVAARVLVDNDKIYGYEFVNRESRNCPIPVELHQNGYYKNFEKTIGFSTDGDLIEAVRTIRQLIGRRVGPPNIE